MELICHIMTTILKKAPSRVHVETRMGLLVCQEERARLQHGVMLLAAAVDPLPRDATRDRMG